MAIVQAIILGIIEGLTEFLPVSSTGHLIVAERAIGYKDTAEIFAVVIQVGAIAAILWFYRHDLMNKVTGLFGGDRPVRRFWANWVIASSPALVAGLALEKYLDKLATPSIIAVALIVGGIAIILVENYHRSAPTKPSPQFSSLSIRQSFQVGCYQILALIPGVSRSGATIMGGLLSGLDRVTATAFSFYLSIPIIVLASGYKLLKGRDDFDTVAGGGLAMLVGAVTAFVVAFFVVGWLLRYVSKHDFKPFAYYRIGLGIVIFAALALF